MDPMVDAASMMGASLLHSSLPLLEYVTDIDGLAFSWEVPQRMQCVQDAGHILHGSSAEHPPSAAVKAHDWLCSGERKA